MHRFLVAHVYDAAEHTRVAQRGSCAPHRVLVDVAQRHAGTGGVESLGDGQADAGAGPGDDYHFIVEIKAGHAG